MTRTLVLAAVFSVFGTGFIVYVLVLVAAAFAVDSILEELLP